jgi:hypothetical protein
MYAPREFAGAADCLATRFIDITNEAGAKEKFPN